MSPVRVLYVINGLGTGGSERSLAELLPALRDDGVQAVVACLRARSEGVQSQVEQLGFDVRVLPMRTWPSKLAGLRRMLKSWRPDVVHTSIFESDVLGRLAAMRSDVPVLTSLVNTSYDPVRLQDPGVRPSRLHAVRLIDGFTARHFTAHFHAVTAAVKESASRTLGIDSSRITVVERGRDEHRLGRPSWQRRGRARAALGLEEDQPVIVNVGRQEYQKGQRHLLEAMRSVFAQHPRSVLLVAGRTGNASSALERLRFQMGDADRIRFLGHTNDIPELLAAADVFAFPSLYEGTGGAAIEAMALGLPIVSSDIPAMREVLEEDGNAVLVRPDDPHALAAGISGLIQDPARRQRYGARSRNIFEERFTLERSAKRMRQLYAMVCGAQRPQAGPDEGGP